MTIEEAKAVAKKRLSPKRYTHTQNVAAAAKQLALRYGADVKKAELAAWLHDIQKEAPRDELLRLLGQDAIMAGSTEQRPFPVWHGPCGAIYAKHELGVADREVLSAIDCHTVGKQNMSLLDKVLFVADMTSAERNYPGVNELRELAKENLDRAVEATLEHSIRYVKQQGKTLDTQSLAALQAIRQHEKTDG